MSSLLKPMIKEPIVKAFFDEATFTVSYVISDIESSECAIIDSVMDYDAASGRTSYESANQIIDYIESMKLKTRWILETHVHADHLSAAPYLKSKLGGKIVIGDHITTIQATFGGLFNAEPEFMRDGSQFDVLVSEDDKLALGSIQIEVMHTPGHTPACVTYKIGNSVFVGDTLFMPDYGTARCDFPGGDARTLYQSIQKIFALPDDTKLYMCHDYKAPGRETYAWETSVGEQKRENRHIHTGVSEQDFCEMRTAKDKTLSMPKLILPSVQVNMRAGELPPEEENGVRYLKIPLNAV